MRCSLRILTFMLLFHASARTQQDSTVKYYSPRNVLSFADYLYEGGEYIGAAAEYRRFMFLSPLHSDSVQFRIGHCYLHAEQCDLATRYFELLLQKSSDDSTKQEGSFWLAYSYFLEDKFDSCLSLVSPAHGSSENSPQNERTAFLLAAASVIAEPWKDLPMYPRSSTSKYPWQTLEQLKDQWAAAPRKSPFLASLLSALVPGLGRVYGGKSIDGLFSLVAVSLAVWQAYDGFSKDGTKSIKGWFVGTVGLTLYVGNVYGSALVVELSNRTMNEVLKREVRSALKVSIRF